MKLHLHPGSIRMTWWRRSLKHGKLLSKGCETLSDTTCSQMVFFWQVFRLFHYCYITVVMWKNGFPTKCLRSQRQDFADSAGRTAPLAARMARSPASAPGRSCLSVRHLQVSSPVAKATWDGRACGATTTWRHSTAIRQTRKWLKMTAEVNHATTTTTATTAAIRYGPSCLVLPKSGLRGEAASKPRNRTSW